MIKKDQGESPSLLGIKPLRSIDLIALRFRKASHASVNIDNLQHEKLLRDSLLEAISHAVIGIENRKIIFANAATFNVFGWRPEELIGQSTRILYRNEDDYKRIGSLFYPVLEKDKGHREVFTCVRKDGREITCSITASRIGEVLKDKKIVAVYEDITAERLTAERLKRKMFELTALSQIISKISSSLDLKEVLKISLGSIKRLLTAESGSIMLLDDAAPCLSIVYSVNLPKKYAHFKESVGEGIAGYVAKTGEALLLKKDMKDTRFYKYQKKRKIRDALCVPIISKGKIIGVFNLNNTKGETFGQSDLRLFTILASYVGVAIENAKLYQDVKQGLLNTVQSLAMAVDAKAPTPGVIPNVSPG